MKKLSSIVAVLIVSLVVLVTSVDAKGNGQGCGGGHGQSNGSAGCGCASVVNEHFESLPAEELSDAERAAVIRLRQDEKFARDVYTTLGEKWSLKIFGNIARAEQRHMDLVGLLITRYELEDPIADDTPGVFTDPALVTLYADLVARGQESLEGALRVGATFEDFDLADVEKMIAASDNADVLLVANNLAKGSRNHLRAFTKVLDKKGFEAYSAQYLSQDRVDEIIAAGHERHLVYNEKGEAIEVAGAGGGCGKAKGEGSCKGKGQGKGKSQGTCKGKSKGQGKCNRAGGPV